LIINKYPLSLTILAIPALLSAPVSAQVVLGNNTTTPADTPLVVLGDGASTTTAAVLVGEDTSNNIAQSVVVGNGATVNGMNQGADQASVAIGYQASAKENTVVIGGSATATDNQATAVGYGTTANWQATALGMSADASGVQSVAIGGSASAAGQNAIALGQGAVSAGPKSIAMGQGAWASGSNSVAIGAGSTDGGVSNVVSVGGYGVTRTITNLTAGVNATDAAAVEQLVGVIRYPSVGGSGIVTMGNTTAPNGNANPVTVTNVAPGTLSAASTEAVNGSQLFSTNSNVASLSTSLANGTIGLVQQVGGTSGTGSITVGAGTGGTLVDFSGTSGARQLTGVAAGMNPTDAVNVSQLQAVASMTGNAVQYDNLARTSVTLGGVGAAPEVLLTNVARGSVSATSTDAVNGSQLFMLASDLSAATAAIANLGNQYLQLSAVSPVADATSAGLPYFAGNSTGAAASATGSESIALGGNSVASAAGSVAVGSSAQSTGANAVAIGAGASATGRNSVALGQGSVASADNSVSVGNASTGLTRTITNVAPGVSGTDGVNVNQLNGAVSQGLYSAERYADRGVSAALAMPSVPVLSAGDKWVGVATGGYGSATALGVAVAWQATANMNVAGGVSAAAGGSTAFRLQAGYRWQ